MTYRVPARRMTRRAPSIRVAGLLVVAAIAVSLGFACLLLSYSPAASPMDVLRNGHPGALSSTAATPIDVPRSDQAGGLGESAGAIPGGTMGLRTRDRGALREADGVLPDGTTVFDDGIPGIAKLDPDLLAALRRAASAAADDGVKFVVDSGWRSPAFQDQLLREAVLKYGSEEEAARWVATADTSPHVSGDAVDIGPFGATVWLSEHGARYGLCQIYRNEPWHYELRPRAVDRGCPRMYADPTHDPRMQR
jgi:D-alanyl-D-alanine carboxypeptidase